MFEIGCYSRGDDFSSHGRVFWTIDVNSPQWLLGITRPLTRFDLSLTGLLVAIFSDKFKSQGFHLHLLLSDSSLGRALNPESEAEPSDAHQALDRPF